MSLLLRTCSRFSSFRSISAPEPRGKNNPCTGKGLGAVSRFLPFLPAGCSRVFSDRRWRGPRGPGPAGTVPICDSQFRPRAREREPPVFVRDRSGDTPCPRSRQLSKNRRPIRGGARGGYTRGLSENGSPRSGPPCPWSSAAPPGKNLGDFRAAHVRCPARGLGGFAESLGRTTGFPSESPWIAPCGLIGGSGGRNQWSPPAAGSGECPAAVVSGEVAIAPVSCSSTSPAGSAKSGSRLPRGCPERFLGNRSPQRRGTKSPVFIGRNGKLGN